MDNEELEINQNRFQTPFILEDINIEIKDTGFSKVATIIVTDHLGYRYYGNIITILYDDDVVNESLPDIICIDLYHIGKESDEPIHLTYHWFKDCLFEQSLKKINFTIYDLAKILIKMRLNREFIKE